LRETPCVPERPALFAGSGGVPIERLREFRKVFDAHLAEFPPKQPIRVGTQRPVYVTDNETDARAAAEQARWNMRVTLSLRNNRERVERGHAVPVPFANEPSTDDILEKFSVIGTPDTCIRQLRRLQEAMGIDHFNASFLFGGLTQEQVLRSMRLFSQEVMPAFR
jgi:alkanesulfonate monooxygenase SsuD/methylene tetrahydromethanopterin reductase-like flavin-dependent oxidoreductase (luciferase family)